MHNLLRCRGGSAAFATVIALVPLIGVVALGGEAGSWYVTKQHAQNAADAAAYSGGLRLACSIAGQTGVGCTDTNSVDYRGKEFAAQNAFCNAGDTTAYPGSQCVTKLPAGTTQTVQINSLTSWNGVNGNFVQATVSQQQPTYLAKVLGLSTVNIPATAIAQVQLLPKPPCVLALKDSVSLQGSPTLSSPTCGVASDSTAPDAISFTGNNGINLNAPTFTVGGCSQTGGNQCDNVTTYAAPIPNPLSGLDSAMSSLTTSNFSSKCPNNQPTAYEKTPCYNGGNPTLSGTLNGTYFFNGNVKIGAVTGTATLILFGNATLAKITGNPTIQLTAETNPQVPPALSSVSSLMKDLLIYDPEPYSKTGVDISGDSSSYFNGTVYVPNTPVTYGGNSSVSTPGCFQVIAYAVTFSGNTKLDESKCVSDGAVTLQVQYVRLVQ
jgi:Flp pilus assembly protein TadG